jgi:hypothetical protein
VSHALASGAIVWLVQLMLVCWVGDWIFPVADWCCCSTRGGEGVGFDNTRWKWKYLILSAMITLIIGVIKEVGDWFSIWPWCPPCTASGGDFTANIVGVLLACLIYLPCMEMFQRRKDVQNDQRVKQNDQQHNNLNDDTRMSLSDRISHATSLPNVNDDTLPDAV